MITANGIKITPTIFPDKTSQVWKIDESILKSSPVDIWWEFESEAELLHLAQLKTLLDHFNCSSRLHIPYLPYARQDKDISNEATFALHSFMDLLNSLCFEAVTSFDAHSSVSKGIFNFVNIDPILSIKDAMNDARPDCVVFPDKGAMDRYKIVGIENVFAQKTRDQSTGEITGTFITESVKGKKCLIIDDLCDGGMTFIKLSQLLIANGAIEVDLYVSHGLFTKGIQVLTDAGINHIYTRKGKLQ